MKKQYPAGKKKIGTSTFLKKIDLIWKKKDKSGSKYIKKERKIIEDFSKGESWKVLTLAIQ